MADAPLRPGAAPWTGIAAGDAVSIAPTSLVRHPQIPDVAAVPLEVAGGPTAVLCARVADRRAAVEAFFAVASTLTERALAITPGGVAQAETTETSGQRTDFQAVNRAGSGVPRSRPAVGPHTVRLTGRERQVLSCLAAGWTAHRIAHALAVRPATVRKHLEHIYAKFDDHDRLTVVAEARKRGIIP